MASLIETMPRPRPPHLHREPLKRGEARWYVRIGHGPRTRIKERYGTPEFDAAYQAAIAPRAAGEGQGRHVAMAMGPLTAIPRNGRRCPTLPGASARASCGMC
jgi:hypothetical protein